METIKVKDASPEQIKAMHQRLAQRKENRIAEIEINEAIALVNRKGKPAPHPIKAPVKKAKPLGPKLAKATVRLTYMLWVRIKNLSINDWIFILSIVLIIYVWIAIT